MNNTMIEQVENFRRALVYGERSRATVEKYVHDVRCFAEFLGDRPIEREVILDYKVRLGEKYAISSANSMIAALNSFLRFIRRGELCIKQFRRQRDAFRPESKELTREEYTRLVKCAGAKNNERLSLVIQTICATGIRVSELRFITVEAAKSGVATVDCKGKIRRVFIVKNLCQKLLKYAKMQSIVSGAVFVSKRGAPISRHSIWREMKSICKDAGVLESKVFPHNLRHLFARIFYGIQHDIVKLADILGHSSIDTTRIYVISTGSEHRRKMENMRLVT